MKLFALINSLNLKRPLGALANFELNKYMTHFNPCKDRNACTEDGTVCKGCGRTHVEIARTRAIVADIVDFVSAMRYENPDEFMGYLTRKVLKKTKITENIR